MVIYKSLETEGLDKISADVLAAVVKPTQYVCAYVIFIIVARACTYRLSFESSVIVFRLLNRNQHSADIPGHARRMNRSRLSLSAARTNKRPIYSPVTP
jgi:hypothetical protein